MAHIFYLICIASAGVESDVDTEPSPKENHKDIVAFPMRNGDMEERASEKRKSQEQTYEPVTVGAQVGIIIIHSVLHYLSDKLTMYLEESV